MVKIRPPLLHKRDKLLQKKFSLLAPGSLPKKDKTIDAYTFDVYQRAMSCWKLNPSRDILQWIEGCLEINSLSTAEYERVYYFLEDQLDEMSEDKFEKAFLELNDAQTKVIINITFAWLEKSIN